MLYLYLHLHNMPCIEFQWVFLNIYANAMVADRAKSHQCNDSIQMPLASNPIIKTTLSHKAFFAAIKTTHATTRSVRWRCSREGSGCSECLKNSVEIVSVFFLYVIHLGIIFYCKFRVYIEIMLYLCRTLVFL